VALFFFFLRGPLADAPGVIIRVYRPPLGRRGLRDRTLFLFSSRYGVSAGDKGSELRSGPKLFFFPFGSNQRQHVLTYAPDLCVVCVL